MYSPFQKEQGLLPRDLHALVSSELSFASLEVFSHVSLSANMLRTLLFAPFVPFIVMFCHVIETQDEADLAHLQAFLSSIQSAPSISGPASKLHRLFQVLCRIATGFVNFRVSATLEDGWQDSSTIDHCLDALGFSFTSGHIPTQQRQPDTPHICTESDSGADRVRNSVDTMDNRLRAMDPMVWMANSAELEDWLESNGVITGLI